MAPQDDYEAIRAALARWQADVLEPVLRRFPERQPEFTTSSLPINRLYTPLDLSSEADLTSVSPGIIEARSMPPLSRGGTLPVLAVRQRIGHGTAAETNATLRRLIAAGERHIAIAVDAPTEHGLDSDHPGAGDDVGLAGVALDSLADMEDLLRDIPLTEVTLTFAADSTAPILAAMFIVAAENRGYSPAGLAGGVSNDALAAAASGHSPFAPAHGLRLAADLQAYARVHWPNFTTMTIGAHRARADGATAAQEIALAVVGALSHLEEQRRRGADPEAAAAGLTWSFAAGDQFFEEVAKYRAARRFWRQVASERLGLGGASLLRFEARAHEAGASSQPGLDDVRFALQGLAAVLGGVQTIEVGGDEEERRRRLRAIQIIAHETGVTESADALAGAYLVEALTDGLEARARAYLACLDDLGGHVAALTAGVVQRDLATVRQERDDALASGDSIVVGLNRFADERLPAPASRLSDSAERQLERLNRLRAGRDGTAVAAALDHLQEAAASDANLMPAIMDAVRAYPTLQEICQPLRAGVAP